MITDHHEAIRADAAALLSKLTAREREVLALTARGMKYAAIASELGISRDTAKDHKRAIREKMGVRTSIEAAVIAAKAGAV